MAPCGTQKAQAGCPVSCSSQKGQQGRDTRHGSSSGGGWAMFIVIFLLCFSIWLALVGPDGEAELWPCLPRYCTNGKKNFILRTVVI